MFNTGRDIDILHSYPRRNFAVYGVDVMLRQTGEPVLIEINVLPATATGAPLDVEIKFPLIAELMHLVGPTVQLFEGKPILPKQQRMVQGVTYS